MTEPWKKKKLKELVVINYGKSPKGIIAEDGNVPVVGTGGVERFGNAHLYEGESVILGRKGTIDKPTFIDGKFWAIDTTYFLSDFNDANVKWLYYYLTTVDLRSMNEATGVPSLSREFLYKLEIDTPPKEEQEKIAAILSRIDRAIEQTEALIAKQQRIKAGLMHDLLTKGIDEHGNIRSEATHEFKDSPLGRIPVEWDCQSFETLLNNGILADIQDGNHGELHPKSRDFVSEGIPFVMATDIADGRIDFENCNKITEQQYLSLRIGFSRGGDVLLSHKGSIGFTALVPDSIERLMLTPQVTYYRIRDFERLMNSYLYYYFQSSQFQKDLNNLAKQSTRDYVGILAQRKLCITFPLNVEEQVEIANILTAHSDSLTTEINNLKKQIALKRGIMQDLLTGKVPVTALLETPPHATQA